VISRSLAGIVAGALAIALTSCSAPLSEPEPTETVAIPAVEIAYQWLAGGGDGIWLLDTVSGEQREMFADLPGDQIHPEWSPDGSMIAFIESAEGHDDIWLAKADGSDAAFLATCADPCLGFDYVTWTPDGEHLVALSYVGPPGANGVPAYSSLSLVDVSNGSISTIVDSDRGSLLGRAHVSPDGESYCVSSLTGSEEAGLTGSAIAVGAIGGGPFTTITDPSEFGAYCDWDPSGDRIVFTTYDLSEFQMTDQASNLFTIAPDGTGLTALTTYADGAERATQPRWSPDGSLILYTKVTGGSRVLAAIGPDGKDVPLDAGLGMAGTHPTQRPG
jgi:Tol biopolymer transport system component